MILGKTKILDRKLNEIKKTKNKKFLRLNKE